MAKKGTCKGCNKSESWIVNSHHFFCAECNRKRIDETLVGQERLQRLNSSTDGVKEMYELFDFLNKPICSGCGQSQRLSHSHIIARSRNKDLEDDIDNIVFDCMEREISDEFNTEGCHTRWESFDPNKMLTLSNLSARLEYVKEKDIKMFEYIRIKFEQNGKEFPY